MQENDLEEIYDQLCEKFSIKKDKFKTYCINKYKHKETNEIYYLENRCQCNEKDHCDLCFDFWILDIFDHRHPDCNKCKILKKYYLAQKELIERYSFLIPEKSFTFQKHYSEIFGGQCNLTYDELEVVK